MHPFVLITGPTGSGKSALAMSLAEHFKGAILNCDSLQTYQRLDIGTAKPLPDELARVPHFLIDVAPPGRVLTAGDFRRMALEVLQRELPERIVFGVGGSGFYIQALEKGMFDVPKASPEVEKKVREEAEVLGLDQMYKKLMALDPEYSESISPNDSYRILRALIIIADSGQKVSELRKSFKAKEFPFPLVKLGLSPTQEQLLPRIAARTRSMLERGLLDEVRQMLKEGYQDWPPLHSVGYRECGAFLRSEVEEGKLIPLIIEKTMQLAKKQKTWFKRDSQIQVLPFDNPEPKAREIVMRFLDSQP